MDIIGDKVTMLVGEASSRVNETRRKWQQQRDTKHRQADELDVATQASEAVAGQPQTSGSNRLSNQQSAIGATIVPPLAGGQPFGGDSFTRSNALRGPPAPPIGFKLGPVGRDAGSVVPSQPGQTSPKGGPIEAEPNADLGASNESLYQGDAWARLWFQRVLILSLLRLLLFIRKVYEDFHATKVYNLTGQTGHFLIAAATLFLPTIVFTVYRVSRYLQVTLPPLRENQKPYPDKSRPTARESNQESGKQSTSGRTRSSGGGGGGGGDQDEEAQLTRALMSSPVQSTTESVAPIGLATTNQTGTSADENEGLVTARQTPTNVEEFHDSKSQQEAASNSDRPVEEVVPKAPSRASRLKATPTPEGITTSEPLESVNIERLLPDSTADRATTRVVTGASEQLLHGVLFIFWQLKRQVDVMGYLVERACLWRKPAEREKEELGRLRTGSDGLEWFQDFYAAFLAILAQVYTLGLHWTGDEKLVKHLHATQLGSSAGALAASDGGGSEPSISNQARAVSSLLSSQALAGNALSGKDVLIMSELIVSTAVVVSLLIAVRRRDDGPLTLGLSFLGWGSLFSARIIIIALSFVQFGWHLMLPLVVAHVLLITCWIYTIALASHNDAPAERLDEAKWDEETAIEVTNQVPLNDIKGETELDSRSQEVTEGQTEKRQTSAMHQTSQWSFMEHVVLMAQILTLFAIPSLFYWPIMFNLKRHFRPFKYLVLILFENFFLITAIWFKMSATTAEATSSGQLFLLGCVGGFSIVGFIFISLYIMCKPSLTEYFARADELFNEAEKSGIYYEFCSRVFKMPDLSKQTFLRLMNQSEAVEEFVKEEVDE